MSDAIRHECAVALLRLRKPPEYYTAKYGSHCYGCAKLAMLLEKQHNRGQDGAGFGVVGLNPPPGIPAYRVARYAGGAALGQLFEKLQRQDREAPEVPGEVFLGHLRYGTFGTSGVEACHPFVRASSYRNHNLLLAGNFNLTNIREIFDYLRETGHDPMDGADGELVLTLLGHYLEQALLPGHGAPDWARIFRDTAQHFDGAYTFCALSGDGTALALRDPAGIRPGFWYCDDEVAVVASERPAIQTAFGVASDAVRELPPGQLLTVGRDGTAELHECLKPKPLRRCVFERIYFSRGNDADIHRERRALGRALLPRVMPYLDDEWERNFFSYIPNTAQISFHGLLAAAMALPGGRMPRFGQIAVKDVKFRTFLADAQARRELFQHVYDITYGLLEEGRDTLVMLDDSIVRGNTMRLALLPVLDRLRPKRLVIASAAPPVCYPDGYGIDMGSLKELVAFEAAMLLLARQGRGAVLEECYRRAQWYLAHPKKEPENCVKPLYDGLTAEELAQAITERLTPEGMHAEVCVVFQTLEALHQACPEHRGDWYFTGNYPTRGGTTMANRALVRYVEHIEGRAY